MKNKDTIMNKRLGKHIKALKNAKNLTQEQIADQIGISKQRYDCIESGMNNITLEVLSKIADALGLMVRDITRVLDEVSIDIYKVYAAHISLEKVLDMLELFYANKKLCEKLQECEENGA